MTPADLRALLEKASPRPWQFRSEWGDILSSNPPGHRTVCEFAPPAYEHMRTQQGPDANAIVALVNISPLLIELWEIATRHFEEGQDVDYAMRAVVEKLEES